MGDTIRFPSRDGGQVVKQSSRRLSFWGILGLGIKVAKWVAVEVIPFANAVIKAVKK